MTPLQKLPKKMGNLGKLIVAKGFKKLPKVQKNRPIWSHCMPATPKMFIINCLSKMSQVLQPKTISKEYG